MRRRGPGAAGGVGGTSGTVGFYVDDISVEAPAAGDNGRIMIDSSVYDMNHVAVLRGPRHALINEQCSATAMCTRRWRAAMYVLSPAVGEGWMTPEETAFRTHLQVLISLPSYWKKSFSGHWYAAQRSKPILGFHERE